MSYYYKENKLGDYLCKIDPSKIYFIEKLVLNFKVLPSCPEAPFHCQRARLTKRTK